MEKRGILCEFVSLKHQLHTFTILRDSPWTDARVHESRESNASEIMAFMRACNTDTSDNRNDVNHSDSLHDLP